MSTIAVTTPSGTRVVTLGESVWSADIFNTGTRRSSRSDFRVNAGTQPGSASSITLGPIVTLGTPPNRWRQRTLTVIDGNGTRTFDLNSDTFDVEADTGMLGIAAYDGGVSTGKAWFRVADISAFTYTP